MMRRQRKLVLWLSPAVHRGQPARRGDEPIKRHKRSMLAALFCSLTLISSQDARSGVFSLDGFGFADQSLVFKAGDTPIPASADSQTAAPPSAAASSVTPPVKPVNKPYTSRIVKEDTSIVLKGQVPSEADLKILQGVIAATSPSATLIDKSRINTGIIERDTWLAGMTFALRQLAKLERGSANLRDNQISFDGNIKPSDNLYTFQQKLMEELPKGLALAQLDLKQPADPGNNVWAAQIKPGSLSLTGYVPQDFDQALVSYAKTSFQNVQVDSAMSQGGRSTSDWMDTAKYALDMLKYLQQGNATMHGNVLTIDGVCSAPGVTLLLKEYEQKLPKAFHLKINVLEPTTIHLPMRSKEFDFVTQEERAQFAPAVR